MPSAERARSFLIPNIQGRTAFRIFIGIPHPKLILKSRSCKRRLPPDSLKLFHEPWRSGTGCVAAGTEHTNEPLGDLAVI